MALVPAAQPRAPATTRSRSRSPPADRGQRCSIALGKEEVEELRRSRVVKRTWFGDRQDCVPVQPSLDMAVEAWKQADPANADRLPSHVLTFFVSLTRFQQWIENDTMKKCNPRVGGYRIYRDVCLSDVDPQYTIHPCA